MPKVYIVQEAFYNGRPLNYADATRYGELELILERAVSILNTAPTVAQIRKKLAEYTADDYLVTTGDPVNIAVASIVAAQQTGGTLQILRFDRGSKKYMPVTINVNP